MIFKPLIQALALVKAIVSVLIIRKIGMMMSPSPVCSSPPYQSEKEPQEQEEEKCFKYQKGDGEEKH